MKKCNKCGDIKSEDSFHKHKTRGLQSYCKDCMKIIKSEWYESNIDDQREKGRINAKKYRSVNLEKVRNGSRKYYYQNKQEMIEYSKKYSKDNRAQINEGKRKRYVANMKDPIFKLSETIRKSILKSLKSGGRIKKNRTVEIIGCSFIELKSHIESKFETWMSWDNHGKYNGEFNYGWDIDHIIPISTAKTEDEILKLNHYLNLQPLCSKINRDIKRNNIV